MAIERGPGEVFIECEWSEVEAIDIDPEGRVLPMRHAGWAVEDLVIEHPVWEEVDYEPAPRPSALDWALVVLFGLSGLVILATIVAVAIALIGVIL